MKVVNDSTERVPGRGPRVGAARHDTPLSLHMTLHGSPVRLDIEPVDVAHHAPLIHDWMNRPHVAPWWQLDRPLDEIRAYLEGLTHLRPWLVSADGVPFGYVETYRVVDDPLASYYEVRTTDVGWHLLVGPKELLGSGVPLLLGRTFVRLQLGLGSTATSGADDADDTTASGVAIPGRSGRPDETERPARSGPHRGDRLVCEPDIRNTRMHAFCRRLGFESIAEIDLPDKRALLMACTTTVQLDREGDR